MILFPKLYMTFLNKNKSNHKINWSLRKNKKMYNMFMWGKRTL